MYAMEGCQKGNNRLLMGLVGLEFTAITLG